MLLECSKPGSVVDFKKLPQRCISRNDWTKQLVQKCLLKWDGVDFKVV